MMQSAFEAVTRGGTKIILTVSPVPLQATFTASDCIVANEVSKSALRVAAEQLAKHPSVDYFPSYEIVRSGGLPSYYRDFVHVKGPVVDRVTRYMLEAYGYAEGADGTAVAAQAEK
jgi:GSCFA family